MEVLVKETVILHKVLSKYLATPTVEVRQHSIVNSPHAEISSGDVLL